MSEDARTKVIELYRLGDEAREQWFQYNAEAQAIEDEIGEFYCETCKEFHSFSPNGRTICVDRSFDDSEDGDNEHE